MSKRSHVVPIAVRFGFRVSLPYNAFLGVAWVEECGHMSRRSKGIVALSVLALACVGGCAFLFRKHSPVPVGQPTAAPEGDAWLHLLEPPHADAWKNITDDKNIFALADGELHIFGTSLWPLRYVGYTAKPFGNFDLHLEVKLTRGANSGIFLRAQPNDPVYRGFEIQVLDDYGKPPSKTGSGAIYDVVTPMFNMARPAGEWNSYDITLDETSVIVIMNGWKVIDVDLALMTEPYGKFEVPYAELPREGTLALQDHGGEVWYRNIRIRPN